MNYRFGKYGGIPLIKRNHVIRSNQKNFFLISAKFLFYSGQLLTIYDSILYSYLIRKKSSGITLYGKTNIR